MSIPIAELGEEIEKTAEIIQFPLSYEDMLKRVRIVGEREGGLVDCYAPVELICTEDVAVTEGHVSELAQSISEESDRQEGTGQLTPTLTAFIEGEPQLRTIDGFHRTAALKLAGTSEIYTTVRRSTWEEVIDLRILTARTHKAVQFARIIEWVNDAWERTPWADKLDAAQAFVMFQYDTSGRRLHVSPEEVGEIKDWVQRKCEQWKTGAMTIYQHLNIASLADPELIQEARTQKSGRRLEFITPDHLKVIAKGLPNRYDFQRLVADAAKRHNLRVPQTRALVETLQGLEDIDEAAQYVAQTDLSQLERKTVKPSERKANQVPVTASPDNLHTGESGALQAAQTAIEGARIMLEKMLAGELPLPDTDDALARARQEILHLGKGLLGLVNLIERIDPSLKPNVTATRPGVPSVIEPVKRPPATKQWPGERRAPVRERPPLPNKSENDISGSIKEFLDGIGPEPAIKTRSHIRQAEKLLMLPTSGDPQLREDLRDLIEEARSQIKIRQA